MQLIIFYGGKLCIIGDVKRKMSDKDQNDQNFVAKGVLDRNILAFEFLKNFLGLL